MQLTTYDLEKNEKTRVLSKEMRMVKQHNFYSGRKRKQRITERIYWRSEEHDKKY